VVVVPGNRIEKRKAGEIINIGVGRGPEGVINRLYTCRVKVITEVKKKIDGM